MSSRSPRVPTYRKHKSSGQAVCTLTDGFGGRRDVLLGKFGTKESRDAYLRTIVEWEAAGRRLQPSGPAGSFSLNELMILFMRHVEQHYRHADGTPTSEVENYRYTLKPVRELYGNLQVADFSPLKLKAVRQRMIESGYKRRVINQRIGRIVRMFRWGVGEEIVPETTYRALAAVSGLQQGRSEAAESEPVRPVADAVVDAVLPFVLPPVRAMLELQRLTGMRPGEVVLMRACDLNMSGDVWFYKPHHHKTRHKGKERIIAIGARGQAIIRPFLTLSAESHLFSPAAAMEQFRADQRKARKTRVQPSQLSRKRRKPSKKPGEHYTSRSFYQCVWKACRKAGVPAFHPHQLRHTHATEVRRLFGLEAAQCTLGHSAANVTQVYAERDLSLAAKVAREIG